MFEMPCSNTTLLERRIKYTLEQPDMNLLFKDLGGTSNKTQLINYRMNESLGSSCIHCQPDASAEWRQDSRGSVGTRSHCSQCKTLPSESTSSHCWEFLRLDQSFHGCQNS